MAKRLSVLLWGAPYPVYKGGEEEAAGLGGAPWWGVLVGFPFPFQSRKEGKGEGVGKGKGGTAPPIVQFRLHGGVAHHLPLACLLFSPMAQ